MLRSISSPANVARLRRALLPALLLCGGLLVSGCKPPPSESPQAATDHQDSSGPKDDSASKSSDEKARRVEVEPIRQGPVRDTLTLSTTLEARQTVKIPTRVSGVVDEVRVRPGDRVTAETVPQHSIVRTLSFVGSPP